MPSMSPRSFGRLATVLCAALAACGHEEPSRGATPDSAVSQDATVAFDGVAVTDGAPRDETAARDGTVMSDDAPRDETAARDGTVMSDGATTDAPGGPCPGVPVSVDGVLDLDVRAVRVRGAVTLRGAPVAPPAGNRGSLYFASRGDGVGIIAVPLSTSGALSYSATLAPGTYDVRYAPPTESSCGSGDDASLPCNGGLVREGVTITRDGALDLDLATVHVRGTVTLRGAAMPDAAITRGSLRFSAEPGVSALVPLGARGAATWSATLLRGTYTVSWVPGSVCSVTAPTETPCNPGTIRADVALTADGALDLDVRAVRVRGAVTLDGGVLSAGDARGAFLGFALGGETATTFALPTLGDARYELTLLPGTYAVSWAVPAGECPRSGRAPCGSGPLRTGVALTADGALDLDVHAVHVRGVVTSRGAPLPPDARRRTLAFTRADGGRATVAIGGGAPPDYAVTLLAGVYAVSLDGEGATCSAGASAALPCNGGPLRTGLALMADGALDVDVPAVRVRGAVTLQGGTLSDAGAGLLFARGDESPAQVLLPRNGPATYDVLLLPGTYTARWAGATACGPDDRLPCTVATLREGAMLTSDGALDLDVRAVHVRGAVTLNGAPMPELASRGAIQFGPAAGGVDATAAINPTGRAAYAATVSPQAYRVLHQGPLVSCDTLPCMRQIVRGCIGM